jgi:ABC-2 type transport system ATP-binding protein
MDRKIPSLGAQDAQHLSPQSLIPGTELVIQAQDLSFGYGEKPVLEGIELAVAAGEVYGLVGADGAGKTTLLSLAAGLLRPTRGGIALLGQDPTSAAVRDDFAFMPQGFGLYPDLSCLENLHFFADLHGLDPTMARNLIRDLLARTGLQGFEQRRARNLSGGMMQKLALACALVTQPRVILLDEPTTGVDPLSRRAFWRLLDGVRAEGVGILYATANMEEAERCDRVGMLQAGRIARQGTPVELSAAAGARLMNVTGPAVRPYRRAVAALPGVHVTFPMGRRLLVWLDEGRTLADFERDLSAIVPGLRVETVKPTLHDVALWELAVSDAALRQLM